MPLEESEGYLNTEPQVSMACREIETLFEQAQPVFLVPLPVVKGSYEGRDLWRIQAESSCSAQIICFLLRLSLMKLSCPKLW